MSLSSSNRIPGFYWVKLGKEDNWEPAQYKWEHWQFIGLETEYDTEDLLEIYPERIVFKGD